MPHGALDYHLGSVLRRGFIRTAVSVIVVLGVGGAIASYALGGNTVPGSAALKIVYTDPHGFAGLTYRLTCDPASGTITDPAAVCKEISKDPGMVFSGTGQGHSCPPSSSVGVSGTDAGQQVRVVFSRCLSGQDETALERWEHLLPTPEQENRVRLDHGLGILRLGESARNVHSLLGAADSVTNGLSVYQPWAGISGGCGAGLGGGYTQHEQILAVRYGRGGRVVTLIGDSRELTIDGEAVPSLVLRCIHFGRESSKGVRELSTGPLKKWIGVSCGGVSALADHRLVRDTTAIVPSGDYPIVVVTSAPTSACKDAASVRRAWRVEAERSAGFLQATPRRRAQERSVTA